MPPFHPRAGVFPPGGFFCSPEMSCCCPSVPPLSFFPKNRYVCLFPRLFFPFFFLSFDCPQPNLGRFSSAPGGVLTRPIRRLFYFFDHGLPVEKRSLFFRLTSFPPWYLFIFPPLLHPPPLPFVCCCFDLSFYHESRLWVSPGPSPPRIFAGPTSALPRCFFFFLSQVTFFLDPLFSHHCFSMAICFLLLQPCVQDKLFFSFHPTPGCPSIKQFPFFDAPPPPMTATKLPLRTPLHCVPTYFFPPLVLLTHSLYFFCLLPERTHECH